MKKIFSYIMILVFLFGISTFTTGCTAPGDNIEIMVTNYSNEYIVNKLYGDHSKVTSIYPDGVNPDSYKVSKKQKEEFAKKDMFVYNGLVDSERELALDLLDINPSLKIIDTAYVLENEYSVEELWLNPASLLMMSQNVKNGLEEYITNSYLRSDIELSYDKLQMDLSQLDVDYRDAVANADKKTILVDDSSLKFLEKFGLEVYCIDDEANDKTIAEVEDLINNDRVHYVYTFRGVDSSNLSNDIRSKHDNVKELELHKLNILTDSERNNSDDYLVIMERNLSQLNQQLYK